MANKLLLYDSGGSTTEGNVDLVGENTLLSSFVAVQRPNSNAYEKTATYKKS